MTPLHGEGHNKPDEQTGRTLGSLISLAGFHTSITLVGCEQTFLWVRLRLSGPVQRPCIKPYKGLEPVWR